MSYFSEDIDNFPIISNLLKFDSEDDFYHLQIIKRRKDNPTLKSHSTVVKTYYIRSIDHLAIRQEEIKTLCRLHNARACINLNRRSFEKVAFHLLRKVTEQIMNKDFRSVRKAYESVAGAHSADKEKKWIIDIDSKDVEPGILTVVKQLVEETGNTSYKFCLLNTKNGVHIISPPFNLQKFRKQYPNIDVHKDNPTILFIPAL